jgi:hypothetical protein
MECWWHRFPGRLEAELAAFRKRGLEFERDEEQFRHAGRLLLRGRIEHDGRELELEVVYPDLFPYFRPEVYAPTLELERHQNPLARNLCLLDARTAAWKLSDTAAWLVAERVPLLLSLFEQGPAAMRAREVDQGEPLSAYFTDQEAGTAIFVPAPALELPREARVGSGRLCFAPDFPPHLQVRALLCELVAKPGGRKKTKLLARAEPRLAARFGGERVQMRWVRVEKPPKEFNAAGLLAAAEAAQPGFGSPPWHALADGEIAVTGVILEEEVQQGVVQDAWVFAVRWRRAGAQLSEGAYVIPGQRLTPEDLGARIPRLEPLRAATVAQVGLGALGAPLALELARNQVGALRLLEHDRVEAAQIVRWPFGAPFVGRMKLNSLATFIEAHYPFTDVERFQHRLGQTGIERFARSESELDLLARFLERADLVIDASAEPRVQQLVGEFARERGIAQLFLSATEGARGGQVGLVVPGEGGCWLCWKLHTERGEDGRAAIPLPPFDAGGRVQPRGCAFPTFTGASFDLLPVVAQAARAAASALGPERPSPRVWVCAISGDGSGAPSWSEHELTIHARCPLCHAFEATQAA